MVAQTPIGFLKEYDEDFQMQDVNCYTALRFLAQATTKL